MKKILLSVSVIAVVAAVVLGVTTAFFSDTETSTGNTFTAGSIDLKIDNSSYYNGVFQQDMSWASDNLTGHLFFNYRDLKPGDWGEDTISFNVIDNPSWLCATITLTGNNENTITEPEAQLQDTAAKGELADELYFIWWADDGDNVLEVDEYVVGNPVKLGDAWLNQSHTVALADSQNNVWHSGANNGGSHPIEGKTTYYIGKAWCYGALALAPVTQGTNNNPTKNSGILCNGAPVTNISQSDSATLDVSFYAVQSRHNEDFVCTGDYYGKERFLRLENKTDNPNWNPLTDNMYGKLVFKSPYPTFDFALEAQGLKANINYSLIYYADPWAGDHPGALIWSGNTDGVGKINTSGNVELGMDLPAPGDANNPNGAKIWLVESSDYDLTAKKMIAWNETNYLFEWNLIKYEDSNN